MGKKYHPSLQIAVSQNQLVQRPHLNIASRKESSHFELRVIFRVVSFVTETKLFEFCSILYRLSRRLCFLDVFTAEKASNNWPLEIFPRVGESFMTH